MTITLNGTTGITTPDLTSAAPMDVGGSAVLTAASSLAAANLTGSLPAISGSALTNVGVTEVDQWRLTTTFIANAQPITSNWERNDNNGFSVLGTGMTESSGIFTFPSTGIYHIGFQMLIGTAFASNYSTQGCWAYINITTNNSSYDNSSSMQQGIYNFSTGYFSGGSIYTEFVFDVTNVSTHKVSFGFGAGQGSESCRGSSSNQQTGVTFTRLGNT